MICLDNIVTSVLPHLLIHLIAPTDCSSTSLDGIDSVHVNGFNGSGRGVGVGGGRGGFCYQFI